MYLNIPERVFTILTGVFESNFEELIVLTEQGLFIYTKIDAGWKSVKWKLDPYGDHVYSEIYKMNKLKIYSSVFFYHPEAAYQHCVRIESNGICLFDSMYVSWEEYKFILTNKYFMSYSNSRISVVRISDLVTQWEDLKGGKFEVVLSYTGKICSNLSVSVINDDSFIVSFTVEGLFFHKIVEFSHFLRSGVERCLSLVRID